MTARAPSCRTARAGLGARAARGMTVLEIMIVLAIIGLLAYLGYSGFRVWTTFPFGLTRKSVMFHGEAGALVRPRRIASEPTVRSRGGEVSAYAVHAARGREGEFYALREYSEGDAARSIAWRATARLGRPVVREVAVPPERREVVVIERDEDTCLIQSGSAPRTIARAMSEYT